MNSNDKEPILSFKMTYPKIPSGRAKNKLATVNNMPIWYRFMKTKIKNNVIEELNEWVLPESDLKLKEGSVRFTIQRHNKRRIDADSCALIAKFVVDILVKRGYFIDDEFIQFIYSPREMQKEEIETLIKVEVFNIILS